MSNQNLLKKAISQISELAETLNQLSFQIQSLDNGLITNEEFKSSLDEIKPEIKFSLNETKTETKNFILDLETFVDLNPHKSGYIDEVNNDKTSDERLKQIQVEVDNFINKMEK
jgi:superfamily I DNA/RNA helicase